MLSVCAFLYQAAISILARSQYNLSCFSRHAVVCVIVLQEGILHAIAKTGPHQICFGLTSCTSPCRIVGVSDLCDYPPDAASLPKASRSAIETSSMTSKEVEARMQQLKAEGAPPFTVDVDLLAKERPALVLTQDTCAVCDVDSSTTAKVPHVCLHPCSCARLLVSGGHMGSCGNGLASSVLGHAVTCQC